MAKSEPKQTTSTNDQQFRAVVKRLLDTPPMHKPSVKAKKPKKAKVSA